MLKPLDDNIVVREVGTVERTTPGGIHIPDTVQDVRTTKTVEVLAVGPGRALDSGKRLPLSVSVGETVVISSFAGSKVELGSEVFVVVKQSEVLGVVEV